jgi:hypothetical protein
MHPLIQSPQNEFWFHVANQDEIPIFGVVDKDLDMPLLMQILQGLPVGRQDKPLSKALLR